MLRKLVALINIQQGALNQGCHFWWTFSSWFELLDIKIYQQGSGKLEVLIHNWHLKTWIQS